MVYDTIHRYPHNIIVSFLFQIIQIVQKPIKRNKSELIRFNLSPNLSAYVVVSLHRTKPIQSYLLKHVRLLT